jgi:hypothetical protein
MNHIRRQLWGNSMHIAPELHREANRVSNSVLVAELHFGKQVATPPPPSLPELPSFGSQRRPCLGWLASAICRLAAATVVPEAPSWYLRSEESWCMCDVCWPGAQPPFELGVLAYEVCTGEHPVPDYPMNLDYAVGDLLGKEHGRRVWGN